jgi:hypothetical protein
MKVGVPKEIWKVEVCEWVFSNILKTRVNLGVKKNSSFCE